MVIILWLKVVRTVVRLRILMSKELVIAVSVTALILEELIALNLTLVVTQLCGLLESVSRNQKENVRLYWNGNLSWRK